MGRLIGIVLSRSHQWTVRAALFLALLLVLVAVGAGLGMQQVQSQLDNAANAQLQKIQVMSQAVKAVFEDLRTKVTAEACSAEFLSQLRLVAMKPDGINEMIYMPKGVPLCSANFATYPSQVRLGAPDVLSPDRPGSGMWLPRPLDTLGYPGLVGVIVRDGDFAVLAPASSSEPQLKWAAQAAGLRNKTGEFVRIDVQGDIWPMDASGMPRMSDDSPAPFMWTVQCGATGNMCVSQIAQLGPVLAEFGGWIELGLVGAALFALWLSGGAHRLIRRYFAFEARFLRHFTAERIICTYQPVLDMATGRISGCEVLVRWRDLDDRVVFPDQFLPIIERHGLTLELTRFVIDRAHAELTTHLAGERPLQVNFNVAPRDLDSAKLLPLFSRFDLESGRFRIVAEIVETEAFDSDSAARAIDELRRAGVGCYLDDFGRGFSSIHSIAALSVDAVKLDRSFAMASDASLLAQMLPEALAMIRHAGRKTVVEGVETEDRLAMLRATGLVDFIQGYIISRPVPIQRFVQVLAEYDAAPRQSELAQPQQRTVVALRR